MYVVSLFACEQSAFLHELSFCKQKSPIDSWDDKESYVGAAVSGAINASLGSTVSNRDSRSATVYARKQRYITNILCEASVMLTEIMCREKKCKTMHICLGTDVDVRTIRESKVREVTK
jgi:hypothetical protein